MNKYKAESAISVTTCVLALLEKLLHNDFNFTEDDIKYFNDVFEILYSNYYE